MLITPVMRTSVCQGPTADVRTVRQGARRPPTGLPPAHKCQLSIRVGTEGLEAESGPADGPHQTLRRVAPAPAKTRRDMAPSADTHSHVQP